MPKGYWIAHVSAEDAEQFQSDAYKAYISGAAPAFKEFNGRFLARGGAAVQVEGADLGTRHVVIEFDSLEQAQACYNSPTYLEAKAHRLPVANAQIILLEGLDQ